MGLKAEPQRRVIFGCGGHGRVVLDVLRAQAGAALELEVVFVDDNPLLEGRAVDGVQVLSRAALGGLLGEGFAAIVGIGENHLRARLYGELKAMGFPAAKAVHPGAIVSRLARLAEGVVLMPGAVVNTGAQIGENVCVNTCASVDHDAVVGAHAHLFPGVRLTGNARVGRYATIASGAVVAPGVRIGQNALVGAGAVVLRDIPDNAVAYGVPARVVRYRDVLPAEVILCAS